MGAETVLAGQPDVSGQVSCLPSLARAFLSDQSLYINVFESLGNEGGWVSLAPGREWMCILHVPLHTCMRIARARVSMS